MESLDTVFSIISIALSLLTLCAMVFGIQLGRKAFSKNLTLYGSKAVKRYDFLRDNILKGKMPEKYVYGGGTLTTPQLKIEKMSYDSDTMPVDWKRFTKVVQFFTKADDSKDIQVEEWLV